MKFQKKKITEQVLNILDTHFLSSENQREFAAKKIVDMFKKEHEQKLRLNQDRINAEMRADKTIY